MRFLVRGEIDIEHVKQMSGKANSVHWPPCLYGADNSLIIHASYASTVGVMKYTYEPD